MRKIADRVVLVAHICLSTIFVLISVLVFVNVIPLNIVEGALVIDSFVLSLMIVLAVVYVVLSLYLLYSTFIAKNYLKEILLYKDLESSTNASLSVLKKIAVDNSRLVKGLKIAKMRITADDKQQLKMGLTVNIACDNVSETIDTMRCLLIDSYMSILGIKFQEIDFVLSKVKSQYKPSVDKANKQAKVMGAGRKMTQEIFEQPIIEEQVGNISADTIRPITDDEDAKPIDADARELLEKQKRQDYEKSQQELQYKSMYGAPETRLEDDIVVEITDTEDQSQQVDVDDADITKTIQHEDGQYTTQEPAQVSIEDIAPDQASEVEASTHSNNKKKKK